MYGSTVRVQSECDNVILTLGKFENIFYRIFKSILAGRTIMVLPARNNILIVTTKLQRFLSSSGFFLLTTHSPDEAKVVRHMREVFCCENHMVFLKARRLLCRAFRNKPLKDSIPEDGKIGAIANVNWCHHAIFIYLNYFIFQ